MAGRIRSERITGQARRELSDSLAHRYRSGESIRALATSTDRSYGFVHRMLVEAGVTLRGRGGPTRRRRVEVPTG